MGERGSHTAQGRLCLHNSDPAASREGRVGEDLNVHITAVTLPQWFTLLQAVSCCQERRLHEKRPQLSLVRLLETYKEKKKNQEEAGKISMKLG